MSTSGRSYVQRVPASVAASMAARLAGVRAVSSFFITSMLGSNFCHELLLCLFTTLTQQGLTAPTLLRILNDHHLAKYHLN